MEIDWLFIEIKCVQSDLCNTIRTMAISAVKDALEIDMIAI